MGFRGEAIPSIASISKFTILTTPADAKPPTQGTLVSVDGGKIIHCAEAARSQGTTIEVKSLFFNVPVRKKFQKSPTYDANEILKVMTVISLGYPCISFQLISQGKTLLNTPVAPGKTLLEQLQNRVSSVLGPELLGGMHATEEAKEGIELQGLLGGLSMPGQTAQANIFSSIAAPFFHLLSLLLSRKHTGLLLPAVSILFLCYT
jgi:DNA mismatch repair protein MutL